MATINMHQAKTRLSDLVARAEAGEEIFIARRNKPVVKLLPIDSPDGARAFALNRGGTWQGGSSEESQSGLDLDGMSKAVSAGAEFTIMRDGRPVARVLPIEKTPRVPGALKEMMTLPDSFFDPLSNDELDAWEGKYSSHANP